MSKDERCAGQPRAWNREPRALARVQVAARRRRIEEPAVKEEAMDRTTHFADAATIQMALAMGMVDLPWPKWDPHSEVWVIRVRPRQGGGDWVLTRGNRPAHFAERQKAWETARHLRVKGAPYLVGRR